MARILITSALPYINGIKHLGNLAGSMLPADVWARFKRAQGHDVLYICATDEHGTPAELAGDFDSWSRRYGMETLAKLFAIPFTTFGYGYYDEVPAAYVLKYFNPGIARALVNRSKFFNWKDGVQELWERTAASLNVRYGVDLVSAARPAAGAAGTAGASRRRLCWARRA